MVNEVMVDGSSVSFGADEDAAIHPQAGVSVHEAVQSSARFLVPLESSPTF